MPAREPLVPYGVSAAILVAIVLGVVRDAAPVARAAPEQVAGPAVPATPARPAAPVELAEVADPAPLVYREVSLGLIAFPKRLTWTLRRDGDRASLLRSTEAGVPHEPSAEAPAAWRRVATETYAGRARQEAQGLHVVLASAAGEKLELRCRTMRGPVHRAGAILIPTPVTPGVGRPECGDTGVWRPAATQQAEVLACATDLDLDHLGEFNGTNLLFSKPPGIESYYVNSDCLVQGGGLRRAIDVRRR